MSTNRSEANRDSVWFEELSRAGPPALRLFCFPYAGGSAEIYRSWQAWFPEQVDICLVHLPGRGKRIGEQAFTVLTSLVNTIAQQIQLKTNVPYALYGHSMGALISFELGRKLFRMYPNGPEHVFVSGHRPPQLRKSEPPTFNLPHDEFIAELRRLNGTAPEVLSNPELMEIFMNLLRADFKAVETYVYSPGEPLLCPITVYCGTRDEHVPVESCKAWQDQTSSNCTVRTFAGGHFFIRDAHSQFGSAFRKDVLSVVPASRLVRRSHETAKAGPSSDSLLRSTKE